MKKFAKSDTTEKSYNPSEVVRILNIQQVIGYINYGVELLDVYTSKDVETDKPLLVFLFNRKQSKEAYDLWCKHELN